MCKTAEDGLYVAEVGLRLAEAGFDGLLLGYLELLGNLSQRLHFVFYEKHPANLRMKFGLHLSFFPSWLLPDKKPGRIRQLVLNITNHTKKPDTVHR